MAMVTMEAGYRSKCEDCGEWIEAGELILWDPENRVAYCEGCLAGYRD